MPAYGMSIRARHFLLPFYACFLRVLQEQLKPCPGTGFAEHNFILLEHYLRTGYRSLAIEQNTFFNPKGLQPCSNLT